MLRQPATLPGNVVIIPGLGLSVTQENETRPQRGAVQEDDRVPVTLLDGMPEFGASEFGRPRRGQTGFSVLDLVVIACDSLKTENLA